MLLMFIRIFILCTVIFVGTLDSFGLKHEIKGSLRKKWTFNLTLVLHRFGGSILYSYDYERNILEINSTKDYFNTNIIEFKYNKMSKKHSIKNLCGCDPCDESLVRFDVTATSAVITLRCNGLDNLEIERVDIDNRDNDDLDEDTKLSPDRVYLRIAFDRIGCLDSLYYKMPPRLERKADVKKYTSNFLNICPRQCVTNECNKGKCRSLYSSGGQCDCSYTALNGRICNRELKTYKKKYVNTYTKNAADNFDQFKLTWKTSSSEMLCLLELVSIYQHATLRIHGKNLLLKANVIGTLNRTETNFITVKQIDGIIIMKLNNEIIKNQDLNFHDEWYIHVGFTAAGETCKTFIGTYDVETRLLPTRYIDSILDRMNIRAVLLVSGTTVAFYTLIVVIVWVMVKYCRFCKLCGKNECMDQMNAYNIKRKTRRLQSTLDVTVLGKSEDHWVYDYEN